MVKKVKPTVIDFIAAINASALTAKEKEQVIDAYLKQKVQRNEDVVEE